MHTVYILRSLKDPKRVYVGYTANLDRRLKEHNRLVSTYSRQYAPWEVETSITFKSESTAKNFEMYLKAGSGHAFLHKRLISG